MYMVQLYKEDWKILRTLGFRAVALPGTEQIVKQTLYTLCTVKNTYVRTLSSTSRNPDY